MRTKVNLNLLKEALRPLATALSHVTDEELKDPDTLDGWEVRLKKSEILLARKAYRLLSLGAKSEPEEKK